MPDPRHFRLPRPLVTSILAALLVIQLLPVSATRAADDTNIPGVPLPGRTVTGQLGGTIYDHVYSIDVPVNSLILISLTGAAGTDFDLYLFDSSAATIYGVDGLVAKSTGSTSTESITQPAPGGGRYYVNLNGATEVQGAFRMTVAIQTDSEPPRVQVQLEGGAPTTSNETVAVTVVAADDLSGAEDMQVSGDGITYGNWQPYAPAFLWTFAPGDGEKRFWARVRDRAGNVSEVAQDSILLDTVRPSVVSRGPGPDEPLHGLQGAFRVQFDEPLRPGTWLDHGLIIQRADGTAVEGTYAWDEASRTGSFVPATPLVLGERVSVTLGSLTDRAGNLVVPVGTWSVTPLLVQAITLAPNPSVITSGAASTLFGRVEQPGLSALTLESAVPGGEWTVVGPVAVDAAGSFVQFIRPAANTSYRIHSSGSAEVAESTSAAVRVIVRRAVTLTGPGASTFRTAIVRRTTSLVAQLTPSAPATPVTLTVRRYNATRRAYVTVQTLATTSANGRATFAWRPTVAGSYTLRISTPTTPAFASGASATYRFNVK